MEEQWRDPEESRRSREVSDHETETPKTEQRDGGDRVEGSQTATEERTEPYEEK